MVLEERQLKAKEVSSIFETISKEIDGKTIFLISENIKNTLESSEANVWHSYRYSHWGYKEDYHFELTQKDETVAIFETQRVSEDYYKVVNFATVEHHFRAMEEKIINLNRIVVFNFQKE